MIWDFLMWLAKCKNNLDLKADRAPPKGSYIKKRDNPNEETGSVFKLFYKLSEMMQKWLLL